MIKGEVQDLYTKKPLQGVHLSFKNQAKQFETDTNGRFEIKRLIEGPDILYFNLKSYVTQQMPIALEDSVLDLGVVYLEINLKEIQNSNQMIISEEEIDIGIENTFYTGILSAERDLLARRAAFDFSQAFFRIRGYDSRNGIVQINGIPMNNILRGRPQWNNWGGLNDVMRNQEHAMGLQASVRHFGDVLGVTNIETRPSALRSGLRFSSSYSNKTYTGRIMATYNSSASPDNLGYSISTSRRWASEGYINGTAYDAYSIYGALEYQFGSENGIYLTGFLASNKRGRNSALTQELFDLAGNRYNPYWGIQATEKRNSRIRKIKEPVLMLNYYHRSRKLDIEIGLAYQWGQQSYSRIGYYNAPNPNPDYYRYLPSYYINSPIGANFIGATSAKMAFKADPQLNWTRLYQINRSPQTGGRASYILYEDISDQKTWRAHSHVNLKIGAFGFLDLGFNYISANATYYARIDDLFGADYHLDIDPFSETLNNTGEEVKKDQNDIFGYHYIINSPQLDVFTQLRYVFGKWNGFVAGKYYDASFRREGLFRNERYPENSRGPSRVARFSNYGFKAGISRKITNRHRLEAHASYAYRAPVLANIFINPRENNEIVQDIRDEKIQSVDLGYLFQLPQLSGRLTGYYTRFRHTTDINYFFVNSGVGSDFVQQVVTDLDRLHAGMECGVSYRPSSVITLTGAASISRFLYASSPNIAINFDTAGPAEDLINIEGQLNLGPADIKDLKMARGPAQAVSLGLTYRDPKFWWVSATINRLSENYISISPITRTESFKMDPDTGKPFPAATDDNIKALLAQTPLPEVYLLNMNVGKSWLWEGKYIGVFASISNMLDSVFKSGGYEQSRNGNFGQVYRDNLGGRPSFGPKFWFGLGRTYFINLSVSF